METAGALAELFGALQDEGRLVGKASVRLVDRGKVLLGPFSDRSHVYAFEKLTEMGVDVSFGVAVASVEALSATLSDGSSVATDTVIWAGGISGASIVELAGIPPGHGGRIDVAADLTVPGYSDVSRSAMSRTCRMRPVAPFPSSGRSLSSPVPGQARTSARSEREAKQDPFDYHDKGIMAMVGRNAAVAEIGRGRRHLEGPLAFGAWLALHATLLSGFRDRVDAVTNWAEDYILRSRAADLELEESVGRIAWADDPSELPAVTSP